MAKRHVEKYYNEICEQYQEMLQSLKDLQDLTDSQIVSPQKIKDFEMMIEPIKVNYERISYIMFLLNKPNKEKKIKKMKYELLEKINFPKHSLLEIKNENESAINNIKNEICKQEEE